MIKQLKKHLKEKKKEWLNILNNHSVTDTEKPLADYAKGALDAYIEINEMIERTERNAKDTEETRRVRELADAQAGLAQ